MAVLTTHRQREIQPLAFAHRAVIVGLTLATAAIHVSLGGMLFLMNAMGYAVLALVMILPGPFARLRWLSRYALIGFAAVTVVAWLAFGARFDLAYLDKGIEVALIGLVLIESWVIDGGPLAVARRAVRIAGSIVR
jgi:hypothetical protein